MDLLGLSPGKIPNTVIQGNAVIVPSLFEVAPPVYAQLFSCGVLNLLVATLKPQNNEPSYSNTVIGILAVDGWAVTFGTARRGLGGAAARSGPSSLYQM